MTTYYVDQTTGDDADTGLTEALAWKTIAKVNGATFAGDDSCLFKCGEVWRETLIPHNSGTTGHPITYGSYGTGAKPIISAADVGAPTTPVRNDCIELGDGSATREYLTFDGLEIAYPVVWGLGPIKDDHTAEITVQNCTFTKSGLYLRGPTDIIQDNVFIGPSVPDSWKAHAISIMSATATNCSVLRNTLSGYDRTGIYFGPDSDSPTVNDNIIYDIARGTSDEGFGIDIDGYSGAITGTVTVLRNTIYNCGRHGILIENCSEGSSISRNLIHDCETSGITFHNYNIETDERGKHIGATVSYNIIHSSVHGIRLLDVSGVNIWNNVFDASTGWAAGIQIVGTPAYNVDIDARNNIFGSGYNAACEVPGDDWTVNFSAFDYNCVAIDVPAQIVYEDTGPHTWSLAQLQAVSKALHCFSTAPGFVDAAAHNYHLFATSPCRDAGVYVGLTEDFEGNPIV